MDSSSHKLYHVHEMDSRHYLNTYFSDKPEMDFEEETLKFPMNKLHQIFSLGHIKGDVLIDVSIGSFVHHLYSACGYFKDIYLLKFNERCIMEVNKWLHTRTGAFDWNHTSTYVAELEGTSGQSDDKEIGLKSAIKKIVKCYSEKENLTDPVVLPPADCIISAWLLEAISKDKDDYSSNMRKMIKLIKPGGHLILLGVLNATYFWAGQDKFHVFRYDEKYAMKVLAGEGFIIDQCDVFKRKATSNLADFEAMMVIAAHRE